MRLLRCPRVSRRQLCAVGALVTVVLFLLSNYTGFSRLRLARLLQRGSGVKVRQCDACNKINRDVIILPLLKGHTADNQTQAQMPVNPNPNARRLVVLVTSAYRNLERRHAVRETWASVKRVYLPSQSGLVSTIESHSIEVHTVFVIGGGSLPPAALRSLHAEAKKYGDLLVTTYTDSYMNLTMQVLSAYQFLIGATQQFAASQDQYRSSRFAQFSWLLKCDDDAYVNVELLLRQAMLLEDAEEPAVIAGHMLNGIRALRIASSARILPGLNKQQANGADRESFRAEAIKESDNLARRAAGAKFGALPASQDHLDINPYRNLENEYSFAADEHYPSFVSGSAYIMNYAAFRQLVKVMRNVVPYRLDDVYVTGLLREAARGSTPQLDEVPIRLIDLPEFLLIENKRFGLTACDYTDWIVASHPVSAEELRLIWSTLHSVDTMRKCAASTVPWMTLFSRVYQVVLFAFLVALIALCFFVRRVRYLPVHLVRIVMTTVRRYVAPNSTDIK